MGIAALNKFLLLTFVGNLRSTETTDQEMDVWVKLRLHSPSITTIKTVSFVVTPVLRTCKVKSLRTLFISYLHILCILQGHDVGYRKCGGKEGYCVREQFFCDGQVNCATKHAVISPG